MTPTRTAALFIPLFILLCVPQQQAIAQEVPSPVQEFYFSANYEEALTILAGLEKAADTVAERQVLREYRALCLIALKRFRDAITVIEQMVDADPFYRPEAKRRPPRLITLFDQVRHERVPVLGRELYSKATIAFDDNRLDDAASGFSLVLRLVEDASTDSYGIQAQQDLINLKLYSTRFLEVTRARQRQSRESVQWPLDTFGSTDAGVIPPVTIRQDIPSWPSQTPGSVPYEGTLEVVIDPAGNVRETRLVTRIHPAYDPLVLESAKGWKYRPATKDGRAVTYRLRIAISVMPQQQLSTTR